MYLYFFCFSDTIECYLENTLDKRVILPCLVHLEPPSGSLGGTHPFPNNHFLQHDLSGLLLIGIKGRCHVNISITKPIPLDVFFAALCASAVLRLLN